jgi:hypothetical protein
VTLRLKFRHIKPRNRRPWNYPQTSISRFAYGPSATRGDDGSLLGGRRSSAGALRLSRDRAGFFRGRLHLDLVRQERALGITSPMPPLAQLVACLQQQGAITPQALDAGGNSRA